MNARPAHTYRSARRNIMRALGLLNRWRDLPLWRVSDGAVWRVMDPNQLPPLEVKGPAE